jgi:hypothetical protein
MYFNGIFIINGIKNSNEKLLLELSNLLIYYQPIKYIFSALSLY